MKKIGLLTATFAAVLAASQAEAQSTGTYIGVSGGAAYTDATTNVTAVTAGIHDETVPNVLKVYAGHMWDEFGIEFGYYDLGKYDFTNIAGAVTDQLKTSAITVSAVYSTPVGKGYSFNAKLGVAFTDARYDCKLACGTPPFVDTKLNGTSGVYGLGLGWQASSNVMLRADYEHFGALHHAISTMRFKSPYDMFSLGVQFQF
jgi:opacity protein-like surface antigen